MALSYLKTHREIFALAALILLFLGATAYYTHVGSEVLPAASPSSLNAAPVGAKALYLLYRNLGFRADRLEADWSTLSPDVGMVLVIEPLSDQRPATPASITALRRWVAAGGTLLYCVADPPRGFDPHDPLAGDVAIVTGKNQPNTLAPAATGSPYLRDVNRITQRSPVRLSPRQSAGYESLFQDAQGITAIHKKLGKGHLLIVANELLTSNSGVEQADNAIFLVNIASAAVGRSHSTILFDEYHHGAGLESDPGETAGATVWSSTPLFIKLTLAHLFGLALLILYNSNRRFGTARSIAPPSRQVFTNYLTSMAGLLRRATAADIAAQALYDSFHRQLTRRLDLPPDAPPEQIVAAIERRYGVEAQALGALLNRYTRIRDGERISEPEMLSLARQQEEWRRRLDLVGD